MVRVPVPDDFERGVVTVAGTSDYHFGEADINLESRDRARDLHVAEDDDGRYIGAPAWVADPLADYLGVTLPDDESGFECGRDGCTNEVGVPNSECQEHLEDDELEVDGETYTCVGNDGTCSREVDEQGGRCWQHEED